MNENDIARRTLLSLADEIETYAEQCGAKARPFATTSPFINGLHIGGAEMLMRAADTMRVSAQAIAQGIDFSVQALPKPKHVEALQRWRYGNGLLDTVSNVGQDGWGRDMVLFMCGRPVKADEMLHDDRWHYLGRASAGT